MLRTLVALLLLLNGAYFAWSQGLLRNWGMGPVILGEPQRLESQLEPQAIRVLGADEARRTEAALAAGAPKKECLMAGPFDAALAAGLESRLRTLLPPDAWVLEEVDQPARWIVYMGPYADQDGVNKKLAELKTRGVKAETLRNPTLQPGVSLGAHANREDANQSLQSLLSRGVRTAKVVQERGESALRTLRISFSEENPRPEPEALAAILPPGKALRPC